MKVPNFNRNNCQDELSLCEYFESKSAILHTLLPKIAQGLDTFCYEKKNGRAQVIEFANITQDECEVFQNFLNGIRTLHVSLDYNLATRELKISQCTDREYTKICNALLSCRFLPVYFSKPVRILMEHTADGHVEQASGGMGVICESSVEYESQQKIDVVIKQVRSSISTIIDHESLYEDGHMEAYFDRLKSTVKLMRKALNTKEELDYGLYFKSFMEVLSDQKIPEEESPDRNIYMKSLHRLEHEFQLQREICSNYVAKVFGYIQNEYGVEAVVMEKIKGLNLSQVFGCDAYFREDAENTPYLANTPALALHIFAQMAQSIQDIGSIVHNDIKPQNFMLEENGYIKLIDFGISERENESLIDDDAFYGSLQYCSYDRMNDKACVNSDVYALGMTFLEFLIGVHPIESVYSMEEQWRFMYRLKTQDKFFSLPQDVLNLDDVFVKLNDLIEKMTIVKKEYRTEDNTVSKQDIVSTIEDILFTDMFLPDVEKTLRRDITDEERVFLKDWMSNNHHTYVSFHYKYNNTCNLRFTHMAIKALEDSKK